MGTGELTHYEVDASRISPRRTACLNSTATMVARDMDIDIESLEATVEGDVNYATYRGEASDDRPGLQGVEVELSVEADDDADLDAWLVAVKDRCPVTDTVENETGVTVRLD